jgi:4-alpha-glucanotransferase
LLWFAVTRNPTAEWLARQITEAFPWDSAPKYLIRDNDRAFGVAFKARVRAMGEIRTFRRFAAEAGPALQHFAAFSVLDELNSGPSGEAVPWSRWPSVLHAPEGSAVGGLAGKHPRRLAFHQYLQFLADQQLGRAGAAARHAAWLSVSCATLPLG